MLNIKHYTQTLSKIKAFILRNLFIFSVYVHQERIPEPLTACTFDVLSCIAVLSCRWTPC